MGNKSLHPLLPSCEKRFFSRDLSPPIISTSAQPASLNGSSGSKRTKAKNVARGGGEFNNLMQSRKSQNGAVKIKILLLFNRFLLCSWVNFDPKPFGVRQEMCEWEEGIFTRPFDVVCVESLLTGGEGGGRTRKKTGVRNGEKEGKNEDIALDGSGGDDGDAPLCDAYSLLENPLASYIVGTHSRGGIGEEHKFLEMCVRT